MAAFKEGLIDKILAQTDIIDLIGEVTKLEKKGKNYMGLCPFHEEKTPSFSVSEDKQLYHCFSCKKSGNALTFVKDTKNLSNQEAIKILADRANIELKGAIKQDPLQKYYDINEAALKFYKMTLNHTKSGKEALRYLNDRGLDATLIETFDLGFAPKSKDALYQALKQKDILGSDMDDLGLIKTDQDAPFDLFRNRILFPVHNGEGKVIAFSGRIFEKDDNTAKYINSPGTKTFEKQKVLYNLHRAKPAIKEHNRAVLFEGFMDVIAAHHAGVKEGLATMGTALSKHHIETIKSLSQHLILCFDGDKAGAQATFDMIEQLKYEKLTLSIARMPDTRDPDDFIQAKGPKAFRELIDTAQSAQEFLYDWHLKTINKERLTDAEKFKKIVFTLIKHSSNTIQQHFLNRLSEDLDLSIESVKLDFNTLQPRQTPRYQPVEKIPITDKYLRAERDFIHYFIKDEYYARRFRREFEDVTYIDKEARDIQFEIFEYYDLNRQSCIVPKLFESSLPEKQKRYFKRYIDIENYPFNDDEFEDLLAVMHGYTKKNTLDYLRKKLKHTETIKDKITLRKKIDAMIKEETHGKRKNTH